jgi:5-methylcytosine-specific restriction protein A
MPARASRVATKKPKRKSAAKRLYGRRWRRWSAAGLIAEPLCRVCLSQDITTAATVRDHIVPHRGNEDLFWSEANIQSLCKPCHDRKTLVEKQ